MDVTPLEDINRSAENTLHEVARNIHDSSLMKRYVEELRHLIRLTSRMEWFPVVYHLVDKGALAVLPILGYYTGKYQLNDTMAFQTYPTSAFCLIVTCVRSNILR